MYVCSDMLNTNGRADNVLEAIKVRGMLSGYWSLREDLMGG